MGRHLPANFFPGRTFPDIFGHPVRGFFPGLSNPFIPFHRGGRLCKGMPFCKRTGRFRTDIQGLTTRLGRSATKPPANTAFSYKAGAAPAPVRADRGAPPLYDPVRL